MELTWEATTTTMGGGPRTVEHIAGSSRAGRLPGLKPRGGTRRGARTVPRHGASNRQGLVQSLEPVVHRGGNKLSSLNNLYEGVPG